MNKTIHIFAGVLIFVVSYFIGKQIDLSDQVFAIYQSLATDGSAQSANIYESK